MRRCTVKPAEIGHALKRRPCWEGQTRLIPFVFYMLSFQAFLKPWRYTAKAKTVKRTLLQKVQSYLQFWRNAISLSWTLYFFLRVALCNQATVVLRHWIRYFTSWQGLSNHVSFLWKLLVLVLWFTLSFGEMPKTCRGIR